MFKKHKSRRARAADLLRKYVKVRLTGKAAGAGLRRTPARAWLLAGGLGAAAMAAWRRRGGAGPTPA